MSAPLSPASALSAERYEQAVIRRVEHLAAGDDALTRRALRLLAKRRQLVTVDEADAQDAVSRARAGEDLEGTLPPDVAAAIDAARDRVNGTAGLDELVRRASAGKLDPLVDEAHREHARREELRTQAEELTRAARARYHRDAIAHTRAELASRVVEHYLGLEAREAAVEGASVALELVERDRDTTEAKLERARQLAARWLKLGGQADLAARELLDALGDPRPDADGLTPRDRARALLAGTLAGAGAPQPVALVDRLLEVLDTHGLAITRQPGA